MILKVLLTFIFSVFLSVSTADASGVAGRQGGGAQRGPAADLGQPTQGQSSSQVLVSAPVDREPVVAAEPSVPPPVQPSIAPSEDMAQLFYRLEQSSQIWPHINDMQLKTAIVTRYIDLYGQFGIDINHDPGYYVTLIDGMSRQSPEMLRNPFDQILRVVAIIEYDYNDGQDKDTLARSVLGEQAFLANKQRLGIK